MDGPKSSAATSGKAQGRGVSWWTEETRDLLAVWGEEEVQSSLKANDRNLDVFEKVAAEMRLRGHSRTPVMECRTNHKDSETIDPRPLQVSTPSPISQVSTSDLSDSLEDDATQISMAHRSAALFADSPCEMNDTNSLPSAGSQNSNEGSLPMLARAQTLLERRVIAKKRRICRVGVLADFARAVVEQGDMEAKERKSLEEKRDKEFAAFMQSCAEQNSELSLLRMAIDRGNDIMQSLVTVLLQRLGSAAGPGGMGAFGCSVYEQPSCSNSTAASPGYRSAKGTPSPSTDPCAGIACRFPVLADDEPSASCTSGMEAKSAGGKRRGSVLEPKRIRKPTEKTNL